MRKYPFLLGAALFLIGFFSCSKEERYRLCDPPGLVPCDTAILLVTPADTCVDLPPEPFNGWLYRSPDYSFTGPIFSPATPNEFLANFIDRTQIPEIFRRTKLNICTGERTVVTDQRNAFGFTWGVNDWILYRTGSGDIWKIKSNGDSLTQLTEGIPFGMFNWCEVNGNQFIIANGTIPDLGARIVLLDPNTGGVVDTLSDTGGFLAYHSGKVAVTRLVIHGIGGIGYIDLQTKVYTPLVEQQYDEVGPVMDVEWLNSHQIIWANKLGIYYVDIHTGVVKMVKEFCESIFYPSISVSPDESGWLLMSRQVRSVPEPAILYTNSDIVLFNVYSGEEKLLVLEP
jgi:hypothetical protein